MRDYRDGWIESKKEVSPSRDAMPHIDLHFQCFSRVETGHITASFGREAQVQGDCSDTHRYRA
jgi:hypothetical protein